ncbi:monocarboxylate transporter 14 [Caerostris extrusa]|uniref:Monocarboxylate transporter 14 n=1 Tax=Caerostris extrusa TaxID=172846 RepID=A0AAV4S6A0_CAEEX|nr:monocarboxylate transporter 14 [Caerostris extrusa]
MVSLYTQYYQMAVYSCVYGITWGGTIDLTPVLLVELLGKDKLNNAYGIYMMITGIALSLGIPVSGVLFNETGSYDSAFYLSEDLQF